MDFDLPEELAEVQKLAYDFAEEIAPSAAQDARGFDDMVSGGDKPDRGSSPTGRR